MPLQYLRVITVSRRTHSADGRSTAISPTRRSVQRIALRMGNGSPIFAEIGWRRPLIVSSSSPRPMMKFKKTAFPPKDLRIFERIEDERRKADRPRGRSKVHPRHLC